MPGWCGAWFRDRVYWNDLVCSGLRPGICCPKVLGLEFEQHFFSAPFSLCSVRLNTSRLQDNKPPLMILCELMRLQCIYIFFFTLFWGLYSDCIQAVNVALPLYCRCSCVFSKSFKSAHDPLLTKWIPCAQILLPPPLFSWTCSICLSSHSKGRIYSNPKKTITFFWRGEYGGCALWSLNLQRPDGMFQSTGVLSA